jgi:S1-C subfamily serine protease
MWTRKKHSTVGLVLALVLGIFVGLMLAGPAHPVSSQNVVDTETQLLRDLYNRVNPSVVSINVRIPGANLPNTTTQGEQQQYAFAAGSGFLYDTAGNIVTNAHVVLGADRVELTWSDNIMMHATVVGIDLDADLAVIRAQGDVSKYQPLPLADSDSLTVGDRAVAIGNPFERSGTMTQGIVSGLHRSVQGLAQSANGGSYTIPDAVQTDAALNPGNSGGPLLNSQGQVIGVNEQIASEVRQSSGVSFAIPSNLVKMVADALIKDGKVQHTWLGIGGGNLTLDINEALKLPPNTHGVYVTGIQPGSPAAKAGLKAGTDTVNANGPEVPTGGDIIVAVDDRPVMGFEDLTAYLFAKTTPGQTVTLTVLRDGKEQKIPVTLAARPQAQPQPAG